MQFQFFMLVWKSPIKIIRLRDQKTGERYRPDRGGSITACIMERTFYVWKRPTTPRKTGKREKSFFPPFFENKSLQRESWFSPLFLFVLNEFSFPCIFLPPFPSLMMPPGERNNWFLFAENLCRCLMENGHYYFFATYTTTHAEPAAHVYVHLFSPGEGRSTTETGRKYSECREKRRRKCVSSPHNY